MAKSAAVYKAESRQRARAAGLCIACCKQRPNNGQSTCAACSISSSKRTLQRRAFQRKRAELQEVIDHHERAGDRAREHHLYESAAQHYKDALNVPTIGPPDYSRISEKLAYALSLGSNPGAADPWFERALASHINKPSETGKTIEILLQRARQLWIDARIEAALPLLRHAVQTAEMDGDAQLCKLTKSRLSNYLIGLGRYKEAESLLDAMEVTNQLDGAAVRATYYAQMGIISAICGKATTAFEYFEQAVNAAKEDSDMFHLISISSLYGGYALLLGNIILAKTAYEQALLLARRSHIGWCIPELCLGYANVLFQIGQYQSAHDYVSEALGYGTVIPVTDTLLAEAGIPVALHMKDPMMLEKCVRISTIDVTFRSGDLEKIGYVTAAFAQWHVYRGQKKEAQVLLHRAAEALQNVEFIIQIWSFPMAIAQFGLSGDIPLARRLIELRTELPCSEVAQACLSLFDAFVAQRQRQHSKVKYHATDAASRFDALGWYGYVDMARVLLPSTERLFSSVSRDHKPFSSTITTLTKRERQVAELVLKGLTNRAIARELSISKYTADSHVASIMNRLGLRSRYQLGDALPNDNHQHP